MEPEDPGNRDGNIVPVPVVAVMPLIAQGIGALGVVAIQNVIQGVLITIKSYTIRTIILGCLFLLLPLAKILMIKAGLISLSPAILSRAGNTAENPYDTPSMQTTHGFIETVLWEVYAWLGDFFQEDEFDDYLYA